LPKIISGIVEVFIYRKAGNEFEFLLLKRNDDEVYPGIWSVAGGRVNENEKAFEAAKREMTEETGLTAKNFYVVEKVNTFYEMRNDVINLVPLFLAEANEGEVKLSGEHIDFKWMNYEDAYIKLHWIGWKNNLKMINEILHDENSFRTLREIKF
jgi:dihydroneopterin triphosphate diphosphatase